MRELIALRQLHELLPTQIGAEGPNRGKRRIRALKNTNADSSAGGQGWSEDRLLEEGEVPSIKIRPHAVVALVVPVRRVHARRRLQHRPR